MFADILSGRRLRQIEGANTVARRSTRIAHTPRCVTCSIRSTHLHLLHLTLGGEKLLPFQRLTPHSSRLCSQCRRRRHTNILPERVGEREQFDRGPDREEGCQPRSLTPLLPVRHAGRQTHACAEAHIEYTCRSHGSMPICHVVPISTLLVLHEHPRTGT